VLQPQEVNASAPMEVTEVGRVTDVRLEQKPKAYPPMEVTESGMATAVRL
jgi:hypothetical protein